MRDSSFCSGFVHSHDSKSVLPSLGTWSTWKYIHNFFRFNSLKLHLYSQKIDSILENKTKVLFWKLRAGDLHMLQSREQSCLAAGSNRIYHWKNIRELIKDVFTRGEKNCFQNVHKSVKYILYWPGFGASFWMMRDLRFGHNTAISLKSNPLHWIFRPRSWDPTSCGDKKIVKNISKVTGK